MRVALNTKGGAKAPHKMKGKRKMRDDFFKKTKCDRCHGLLDGGRICSMFNEQTICMTCKEKEQQRADYRKAVEADHAEIRKGNYNFQGIGLDD